MPKPKDAVEIKIKMNPYPFQQKLKKYGVKTKEELERKLYEEFELKSELGDTITIKVVKGKISSN